MHLHLAIQKHFDTERAKGKHGDIPSKSAIQTYNQQLFKG
jgi:hypothetical protein